MADSRPIRPHRAEGASGPHAAWMFTLNNPQQYRDNPEGQVQAWAGPGGPASYVVFQLEEAPDTGTPHLQGYVIFKSKKRRSTIRSSVPLGRFMHWEVRRGTHSEALEYVTKEASRVAGPWVNGLPPPPSAQGKRNDLEPIRLQIREGIPMVTIADQNFGTWCRNYRAFERYQGLAGTQQRDWPTKTKVWWGPAGTGKTRSALTFSKTLCEENPGWRSYWIARPNTGSMFFDGYDGQEVIVIDEFYGWISRDLMQRLCDRYPLMGNTKGGMTNLRPRWVLITSNQDPENWWRMGLGGPMTRRLNPPHGSIHLVLDPIVFSEDAAPEPSAAHPITGDLEANPVVILSDDEQATIALECLDEDPNSLLVEATGSGQNTEDQEWLASYLDGMYGMNLDAVVLATPEDEVE